MRRRYPDERGVFSPPFRSRGRCRRGSPGLPRGTSVQAPPRALSPRCGSARFDGLWRGGSSEEDERGRAETLVLGGGEEGGRVFFIALSPPHRSPRLGRSRGGALSPAARGRACVRPPREAPSENGAWNPGLCVERRRARAEGEKAGPERRAQARSAEATR